MGYPARIHIRDVTPRDGLQGESTYVSTKDKARLVEMLAAAGVTHINATSFVSPRAVPQMADAEELMKLVHREPGVVYDATVPNQRGADRAVESGMDAIMVFVDASSAANQRSVRRTTEESVAEAEALIAATRARGLAVAGTVGTAFGSPYDDEITPAQVVAIARRFVDAGVSGLALGDTTGEAAPPQVADLVGTMLAEFPDTELSLHFHDTRGLGLLNVMAAIEAGATRFDAAVGGLGGNPFLHNTAGNVCTEDLVHLCRRCGIDTGLDLEALLECNRFLRSVLGHPLPGKLGQLADPTAGGQGGGDRP